MLKLGAFQHIGFTKKTHGFRGELKVKIEELYVEDLAQVEVIFLNIDGRKIPYFIEAIQFGSITTIKLEDYDSKEKVVQLTGKEIFLQRKDLLPSSKKRQVANSLLYAHLKGFYIQDKTVGPVGQIEDIREYPQQEMALLYIKDKELLIPMNEQLILKIDDQHQTILMDLPQGILSLGTTHK